jgi:UDP-glucose 4-epimerase
MEDSNLKALVTGGAGFIGSHVVDALVDAGFDVVVIDDLSTGKKRNLNPAAGFHELDFCNQKARNLVMDEKPDFVFHLAAQVSVARSVREPGFDARQNISGPIDLAKACADANVKRFIFSSSGGTVYGEIPEGERATEEHALHPLSPYGMSKQTFERYLGFLQKEYSLKYTTLRYGNVYGPRQDPHGEAGVIAIFAKALLASNRPRINGDGQYYRDYVYVSDVVAANLLSTKQGENRTFNIGTGVATDVNEVYRLLAECINTDIKPEHAPARPGDLRRSVLDASRAVEELGWEPQYSLRKGLAATVAFFRQHMARKA